MQLTAPFSDVGKRMHVLSDALVRSFPRPQLLTPPAVGVDISDASVKWIILEGPQGGKHIRDYGSEALAEGAVVHGAIVDVGALSHVLTGMREKLGTVDSAHAALPEESAYVFNMHVPASSSREQILSMIEFELDARVPLAPSAAVYDFDRIQTNDDGSGDEIGVTVFPREIAESYREAFSGAGIRLLSLELEARSIARAVSSGVPEPITLLVDFGRSRTGLAVIKRGIPIFTSTVAVGGETIDRAIAEKLALSSEQAATFKYEQGLLAEGGAKSLGMEAIIGTAAALADEVARHFTYWDTRRNERGERMTPVERVLLLGGSANLKGLADYIAARVQTECIRPDIWQHVCSFDDYIPPIDRRTSLQYATAVGLALRGV